MLLSSCPPENHGGDSSDGSQSMLHQDKKAQSTLFAQRALQERRLKPPDQIIACPRCQSLNTKFCYYNNYSLTQPRHFCKNCRRYWTAGGTLRNVPIGGGCRKNKRKQRTTDLSSVLTVESSVSALRGDNAGAALHPYNLAMAGASTSNGYYDHPSYDENSVKHLARAQLSVRAGPSGVSQSAEGSNGHVSAFSSTHGSHSSQSNFDNPTQLLTLGNYSGMSYPQVKQDMTGLPPGDLSAMFEASQSYRSVVAAAAAAGGGSSMGEGGGMPYNIDIESLNNIDATDMQWRMQHAAQQAAHKQQAMWAEEEQEHREGRQVMHHADEKGLMESLRKGKSAMTVSPSSGHDQSEGQDAPRPSTIWQPVPENLQSFEQVSHESSAYWTNGNTWAPLDMHSLNPAANSQML